MLNDDVGVRGRHSGEAVHQHRDGVIAQFLQIVRFLVVPEAGRIEMFGDTLQGGIGHGANLTLI